jgi:predicted transcriptional regulator
MAVTLSPELEVRLQRVVESGRYATVEQAIESVVDKLENEAIDDVLSGWTKEELDAAIEEGLESARSEPLVTPAEAREHLARLRAELARG